MKIRNGFVSNSSSSSFCILGVTSSEIEKAGFTSKELEETSWYEIAEEKGFYVHTGIEDYYEDYCIGIDVSDVDDTIPLIEQKQALAEKLNTAFGTSFTKDNIDFMVDGGHD